MHIFYENMLINSRLLSYYGRKKTNNFPYSKNIYRFSIKKFEKNLVD